MKVILLKVAALLLQVLGILCKYFVKFLKWNVKCVTDGVKDMWHIGKIAAVIGFVFGIIGGKSILAGLFMALVFMLAHYLIKGGFLKGAFHGFLKETMKPTDEKQENFAEHNYRVYKEMQWDSLSAKDKQYRDKPY